MVRFLPSWGIGTSTSCKCIPPMDGFREPIVMNVTSHTQTRKTLTATSQMNSRKHELREYREYQCNQKLKVHSSEEDLRVLCDECDKTYSNRDGLKRHKSSEHLGLRDYKCLECPSKFARKDTLDDHMRRGKHYFMYFCSQCKLTTLLRSKVARDKHVKQCSMQPCINENGIDKKERK